MNDKLLEQVSLLLDDELPPEQAELLLERMRREPELRDRFAQYALLGEALRGRTLKVDLAARVSAALDNEPAHAVPRLARVDRWLSQLRPVAGLAVAASVAIVAVIALQPGTIQPQAAVVEPLTHGAHSWVCVQ